MFNPIFRSPWLPPQSIYDTNFLPKTPLQWLFYPFLWLTKNRHPINAELTYRDPRLSLLLVAACILLLTVLARLPKARRTGPLVSPSQSFLLAYTMLAYALWLYSFAIMRYAVVIEVTGTLSTAVVLIALLRPLPARMRPVLTLALVAALATFTVAWTRPPDYGRIAFGNQVFDIDMTWTPPGTLFVAETGPTAYVTAFIPPDRNARTIGFSWFNRMAEGWLLETTARAIVDAHHGPIYVLVPGPTDPISDYLPMLGLGTDLGPCRRVKSNLDHDNVRACEAHKLQTP
jgi:hypothetical protein